MKVNMMGQTMQEQVCNGVKGYQSMQGQKKDLEEQELKDAIAEAFIFPVQGMNNDKYTLGNTEKVEGTEYYTIQSKSGNKSTVYYFNTKTYLLEIEEMSMNEGGQSQTMTREFKDYKNYEGVMVPGKIIMKGGMPFPLELIISEIKVNKSFDESIFKF
jgi:hypothetical protein